MEAAGESQVNMLEADLFMGTIKDDHDESSELWHADVQVEGEIIHFKLDTGLEANLIPKNIFNKFMNKTISKLKCRLVTYSDHKFTPIGESTLTINGQQMRFHIVDTGHLILGHQACLQLPLIARIDPIGAEENINTTRSLSPCADRLVSPSA